MLRIRGKLSSAAGHFEHGTPLNDLVKEDRELMLKHGCYFDDGVEGSSDQTAPPNSQPDLSLLDETVIELKIKIETLDDLDLLQSLLNAEEAGKKRKSAIKSLNSRIEVLGGGN